MAAARTLTWDRALDDGGASRASLEDMGGASVTDKAPLPNKGDDLYADQQNQLQKQCAALNKISAAAGITVTFAGGVPGIQQATGPGTAIVPDLFTVTDDGIGNTLIEWPEGALPPSVLAPLVSFNTLGSGSIAAALVANGVRVKSWDVGGSAADRDFTVLVF